MHQKNKCLNIVFPLRRMRVLLSVYCHEDEINITLKRIQSTNLNKQPWLKFSQKAEQVPETELLDISLMRSHKILSMKG